MDFVQLEKIWDCLKPMAYGEANLSHHIKLPNISNWIVTSIPQCLLDLHPLIEHHVINMHFAVKIFHLKLLNFGAFCKDICSLILYDAWTKFGDVELMNDWVPQCEPLFMLLMLNFAMIWTSFTSLCKFALGFNK